MRGYQLLCRVVVALMFFTFGLCSYLLQYSSTRIGSTKADAFCGHKPPTQNGYTIRNIKKKETQKNHDRHIGATHKVHIQNNAIYMRTSIS